MHGIIGGTLLVAFLPCCTASADAPPQDAKLRGWIAALDSEDLRERWYAAYAIGQAGPEAAEAVEPLTAILENLGTHEHVRGMAAWALGRMGPRAEAAAPVLIGTLGSAHLSVRRNSPLTLAEIGAPAASPAVPRLLELLADADPEVRVNAATALWRIDRHEKAVPALVAMLAMPGPGAYEAAVALRKLAAVSEDILVERPLADALSHPDDIVRRAAARSLGGLGPKAVPLLEAALEDSREQVRLAAVESLGWMGTSAVESLANGLRNSSPNVRCLAARALGRLGTDAADAESSLVAAINDPAPEVQQAVAWALRRVRAEP